MILTYEACRANLSILVEWYEINKANRNEATTRLQIIDRLFFDCLGWLRDDVVLEESHGGQYADYTFLFPRKLLIVEAKKEGISFEMPVGQRRLDVPISTLLRTTPELRSALEQVAGYCQERGIPFGAVTNGHQLVAFVASRSDGTPPFEGKAIAFSSPGQMLQEFLDLWNLLSKAAFEEQLLRRRLLGEILPSLPPKLSASIKPYPGTKGRNPFQSSMKMVSEFILEDLARVRSLERTFLEACYCYSGELSQYSLASSQMLRARYSALFDAERPGPSIASASFRELISPELLAQGLSRRPVLLIGDVGVGKTTFIRHLINSDPQTFSETAIAVYIDFGSKGTLTSNLRQYILSEIDRQLAEEHHIDITGDEIVRQAFAYELGRFSRGVNAPLKIKKPSLYDEKEIAHLEELCSNKEEHLRRALEVISRKQHKQIVIFLDNTDQRTEEDQQATFLIAEEMAEHWQAAIYVTLRPETYHASMRRGALTGYHAKAFTIAPPSVERVIRKRMHFGLRVTRGHVDISDLTKTAQLDFDSLDILIRVFLRSLRHDIIRCIDNISAGNVRNALDLVRAFFGSGHVDTQKIINTWRDQGGYNIPIHEFQRAMIYGDNVHYDPTRSPVANLFDISSLEPKEHFLQPILLAFLKVPGADATNEGFLPVGSLYEMVQPVGFTPEQIDVAIVRAFNKRLIETAARRIPEPGKNDGCSLRLTTVGLYHLKEMIETFTYLDAVVVDTPILDKDVRRLIQDVHSLEERLERCATFRGYLDNCWAPLVGLTLPFDWLEHSKKLGELLGSLLRHVKVQQNLQF